MDQQQEESKNQEVEIPPDYTCSICLFLLYEPIQLPCKHSFCKPCFCELMDTEVIVKCPYCRGEFSKKEIKSNIELDQYLKKTFPQEYSDRKALILQTAKNEGNVQKIRILYGNTFRQLPNGKALRSNPQLVNDKEWTFYVKVENDSTKNYIQKVDVQLDPTFGDVAVTLRGEPLELKRVGFGEFRIEFKISFQRWMKLQPIKLTHDLEFRQQGSHKIQLVKFLKMAQK